MRSMTHAARAAVAAALAALAATSAAAAADYYLKFDSVKGESAAARGGGGKQLEIESWSWGTTMAGDWDGTIKGPPSAAKFGAVAGLHRDDSVAGQAGAAKFGAVGGMHRDDSVAGQADVAAQAGAAIISPRDIASGMPTGQRQHGWITVAKPLDRGSVRVKVKFPWLDCRVGAAFPDAVLQNAAGRYELKEVLISGCAADGVALNYAKVTVRGWDPAKKQE